MTDKLDAYAPYNFIPFDEKARKDSADPYDSVDSLPSYSELDSERYSGHIDYVLENLTPIAIGEASAGKEKNEEKETQGFFRDGNGKCAIAGSTMRGLIRSNAEILSFSDPGDLIADNKLLFRSFAANSRSMRDAYAMQIRGTTDTSIKWVRGFRIGYICFVKDDSGEHYEIHPVKHFEGTNKTYFTVPEEDLKDVLSLNRRMYREPTEDDKKDKKVQFVNGKAVNEKYAPYRMDPKEYITFDIKDNRPVNFKHKGNGEHKGILMNSQHIGEKQRHFLVSFQEDDSLSPIMIPQEDVDAYKKDYERNCIQNTKLRNQKYFYGLPDKVGDRKLFFYKYECTGQQTEGVLIGFGPTLYSRMFYTHTIGEGVPENYHRKNGEVDYVEALFGFVEKPVGEKKRSYRSRLSFQNAVSDAEPTAEAEAILMEPKPTAIKMYLDQSGKKLETLNTYSTAGFRLNGYKIYHKRSDVMQIPDKVKQDLKQDTLKKVTSRFATIEKNSEFKGRIYYDNLTQAELGLLLLSMRYSEEAEESFMIGKGKPYGYGKVHFTMLRVFRYNHKKRLSSASLLGAKADGEVSEITSEIPSLKDSFRQAIMPNGNYDHSNTIQIYSEYRRIPSMTFVLHSTNVYMPLDKTQVNYKNCDPLPKLRTSMENEKRAEEESRKTMAELERLEREAEKQKEKENEAKEQKKRQPCVVCFGKDHSKTKDSLKSILPKDTTVSVIDTIPDNIIKWIDEHKGDYGSIVGVALLEKEKNSLTAKLQDLGLDVYKQYKDKGKLKIKKV